MYSEGLYQKALAHFSEEAEVNIENEFVRKYAGELCYCYVHGKELIDFDFWTRYEELLGEKISFGEYLAIDREFDLDPHDVTPEDKEIIADWKKGWQKSLETYREEQKIVANLQTEKEEISISKAQLREFLKGIDAEILKDVLPEVVREDPLMEFVKYEVPFRMEELYGIPLTDFAKEELIDYVQNDTSIMFDTDKFDMYLLDKHKEFIAGRFEDYGDVERDLCELLNKEEEGEYGRKPEQFQVIFESEDYIGVYSYNGDNEYYLLDKENGKYDLILGDSPDFVGRYTLEKMESQKDIHIENVEIFGWLTEYSRGNAEGFVPENELGGLHVLEHALQVARVTVPFRNALELLEQQYTGTEEFRIWAEREISPTQENTGNALYNALVLLNEQYEGNEEFVSWAETEIGVSKETMKQIGFLQEEKGPSLDAKMLNAAGRVSEPSQGIKEHNKDLNR